MSIGRVGLCILCLIASASAQTSQPVELQRGEFHTTFTERSPLSSTKEMAHRFGGKPSAKDDYDLTTQKFSVYVPKDYDPATPCGLLVFLCYKHSQETAPTWHDLFDQHHIIFAVTEEVPPTLIGRIGTSLDAVHNLAKIYKIDPGRVWVLGDPPAQELALGYPDVFTAGIYRQPQYFRPIQSLQPNSGAYAPKMARPIPEYLGKSKSHKHVILLFGDHQEYSELMPKAYAQDGFKQMLTLTVGTEPYHYPNFTTDWFEQVLAFLEAPSATGATAAAPASQPAAAVADAPKRPAAPAVNEPQRMLSLAKSYISAKSYTAARTRLDAIIEKFPTDPAATEAKQLLQSLPPP